MGDPTHFSVQGRRQPAHAHALGHAPHASTRSARSSSGTACATLLEELGVRVLVVPPDRRAAGHSSIPRTPASCSTSNAEKPRRAEDASCSRTCSRRARASRRTTRACSRAPGFRAETLDAALRFEGEADLFPARRALSVHARPPRAAALRARARASRPGSASTASAPTRACASCFAPLVAPRRVLRVELVLEAHYHGDTALCAFGPAPRAPARLSRRDRARRLAAARATRSATR